MTNEEKGILQNEILQSLPSNPSGRLVLAPRIGKTKIMIDLIKREDYGRILWVTLSRKLCEEDIPQEFEKWGAGEYLERLVTTTYKSLPKIDGYFDVVILDEEQHLTENNAKPLLSGDIDFVDMISMTGTPSKKKAKNDLYERLHLTNVLYELSINKAVELGVLADYTIHVLQVPIGEEKDYSAGTKKKTFLTSEKKQYAHLTTKIEDARLGGNGRNAMFLSLARRRLILNAKSKWRATDILVSKLKGRKLIFSSNIAQAEYLCKNSYHSKSKKADKIKLQQFMDGEIDELSLVNSGGTGFTYKEIEHQVISQVDKDDNGLTSQKICRTLLSQEKYKASIWLVVMTDTCDEDWLAGTLSSFDMSKVKYVTLKQLEDEY